jgi:hypothetical protein
MAKEETRQDLYIGNEPFKKTPPRYTKFSCALVGGDEETGKSYYLLTIIDHLKNRKETEVYYYDERGDNLETLKKDYPFVNVIPNLIIFINSLRELMDNKEKRATHKKTILVFLDECAPDFKQYPRLKNEIEDMMAHSTETNIYFIMSSNEPTVFSKRMKELADIRVCFFVEDGANSMAVVDHDLVDSLPIITGVENALCYERIGQEEWIACIVR